MAAAAKPTLAEIIRAVRYGDARLEVVEMIIPGGEFALQAYVRGKRYGGLILPERDKTLGDLMKVVGDMIAEVKG